MNFNDGVDYNKFLEEATSDQMEMIKKQAGVSKICDYGLDKLKKIDKEVKVAVFSETRCGDAATAIPILLGLKELNKNINIKFFKTENYKEFLENNLGESRIPTILKVDDEFNIIDKYIEFPKYVKYRLANEEKEDVVREFRSGKYSEEIQKSLIQLILK